MMPNLKKILIYLFIAGLFFIPFNSGIRISFLGEYRNDSNAIFLLLGVLLLGVYALKNPIKFPETNLTYQIFLFFICFLGVSFLINFTSILESFFKQTSGINRFIRQLFSLVLSSVFFFIFFYNVIHYIGRRKILKLVRTIFLISLIIVSVYGFIEFLILQVGLSQLEVVLNLFDYLPFVDIVMDVRSKRLSSITYEVPALAMYLITVAGWMFSYILTHKGIVKYVPTFLVLFFSIVCGSRTSLVVILFQFMLFMSQIFYLRKYHFLVMRIGKMIIASILILVVVNYSIVEEFIQEKRSSLDFTEVRYNTSNKSRIGIQYTSLVIFKENPIFGVGYGQQAFHAEHKYPYWAVNNNWEFDQKYLNERIKSFPPGYNIYTRIMAETGIIGLLLFLCFIFSFFYQAKKLKNTPENRTIGIIIMVSIAGFVLNWLQIDSFRMYGFWLCLALLCFFYNIVTEERNVI